MTVFSGLSAQCVETLWGSFQPAGWHWARWVVEPFWHQHHVCWGVPGQTHTCSKRLNKGLRFTLPYLHLPLTDCVWRGQRHSRCDCSGRHRIHHRHQLRRQSHRSIKTYEQNSQIWFSSYSRTKWKICNTIVTVHSSLYCSHVLWCHWQTSTLMWKRKNTIFHF